MAALGHLGVIRAKGPDASTFLHQLLTQDLLLMPPQCARLSALCSPKGRMLASGWLLRWAEHEWLWVISADLVTAMVKRLRMFVLRSKVEVSDASAQLGVWGNIVPANPSTVCALPSVMPTNLPVSSRPQGGLAIELPVVAGWSRSVWVAERLDADAFLPESCWLALEALAGVGRVTAATSDAYVPQMINFESAGAVSFKKGCYPGQEVVARSQFRGTLKRRGFVARVTGAPANLLSGQEVVEAADPGNAVGTVCNAALLPNGDQVAIVSLQIAASAHPLAVGGAQLELLALPYVLLDDI